MLNYIKSLSCVYADVVRLIYAKTKDCWLLEDNNKTIINLMLIDENVNDISCKKIKLNVKLTKLNS